MRLFVTGSTGFIGSHFVRAALAAGHQVTGLRFPGTEPVVPLPLAPTTLDSGLSAPASSLVWLDGTLDSVSPDSLAGHDALVHLAAAGVNPKQATWDLCFEVNLRQSLQLWRGAVAAGINRFVICGSCFEYGLSAERYDFIPPDAPLEPTGAYHASKAAATMAAYALCVENKLEMAILRPFIVFGEGENPERLWPSLRKAALAGEDFPMTPGEQIRDFSPVEDVARAFLLALELPSSAFRSSPCLCSDSTLDTRHSTPLVANVGTGAPQTIREFAEDWWKKWNAVGKLLPGAFPYRENEVIRYVPEVAEWVKKSRKP
jgi:nucleoside-diphosphate-sugar epimerase